MSALDSRACHIHATSAAKETGRQKTAAASQASTNCSKRSLILLIRIMPMSKNGRKTTIPLRSIHFRSNTPSVASQTAATPPRCVSPRKNTPPLPDRREQTPRGPYRTVTDHPPEHELKGSNDVGDLRTVQDPEHAVSLAKLEFPSCASGKP